MLNIKHTFSIDVSIRARIFYYIINIFYTFIYYNIYNKHALTYKPMQWLYHVYLRQIKYINTNLRKPRRDRVGKRTKGSKI